MLRFLGFTPRFAEAHHSMLCGHRLVSLVLLASTYIGSVALGQVTLRLNYGINSTVGNVLSSKTNSVTGIGDEDVEISTDFERFGMLSEFPSGRDVQLRANISASTNFGYIKLNAVGTAVAPRAGTAGSLDVSVGANFSDIVNFYGPHLTPGTPLDITYIWKLSGAMLPQVVGRESSGPGLAMPYVTALSEILVDFGGIGVPEGPYSGYYGRRIECVTCTVPSVHDPIVPEIPVLRTYIAGVDTAYSGGFSIRARALVNHRGTNADTASANFTAFFSESLTYGGIASVINRTTGQPVTDWNVTSASGFDYSQPYNPIPEPLSMLILMQLCGLAAFFRRKRTA